MLVLVDTSLWIDHLRKGNRRLEKLLNDAEVACHPVIIGELACGNITNRSEILSLLRSLPMTPSIEFTEYLHFVEQNRLYGVGIGFVDMHLLASAVLSRTPLWTADKRLREAAKKIHISFE